MSGLEINSVVNIYVKDNENKEYFKDEGNNKYECIEKVSDLLKVNRDRYNIERIARKIARGEKVKNIDLDYLKNKNPNLLEKATKAKNIKMQLELEIKDLKSREEIKNIISRVRGNAIKLMTIDGYESSVEGNLQLEAINKVRRNIEVTLKKEEIKCKGLNKLI